MKNKILFLILGVLIISIFLGFVNAANFAVGDGVEVYNTGTSGLLVLGPNACSSSIGIKFDGARGTVVSSPSYCSSYNRWKISWDGGLTGWSAENWLRKVVTCSNQCSSGQIQCSVGNYKQSCVYSNGCWIWGGDSYCSGGCAYGQCINSCKTCAQLGKTCGGWDNGCQQSIDCGSCSSGQTCSNGVCQNDNVGSCGPSVFPESFSYSSQNNQNLYNALSSISLEFKNQNIAMTSELLASVFTTLEKEVGGNGFLPVEENGDYGMGPGCSYKINGLCRSTHYDGGVDYKGRGYIQITGKGNYQTYCGSECVGTSSSNINVCGCKNQLHCTVTDQNLCPQIRALNQNKAAQVFVSYYEGKNLISYVNQKNFYQVGLLINGGTSYANDFNTKAGNRLNLFSINNAKTAALISCLSNSNPVCAQSCNGKQCGDDGCGVSCGSCSSGQTCQNGQCINSCVPNTCSQLGKSCGAWDNGCQQSIDCGSCSSGQTCNNGVCQNNAPSCTNQCSSGQTRCNGQTSETCQDYNGDGCLEWGGAVSCSNGCHGDGFCNLCTPNSKYCNGNSAITCHSDGQGYTTIPCENGQTCSNGQCISTCTNQCTGGTSRCNLQNSEYCADWNLDGCSEWEVQQVCDNGCNSNNGYCYYCTPNSKYCEGNWAEVCNSDGEGSNGIRCTNGCSNGACIIPTPNCTESNWQYSLSPTTCPSTGIQTKTWTKIGTCSGGVSKPSSEQISCNYIPPCTPSWSCGSWGSCVNSLQIRTCNDLNHCGVLTNKPQISQSCCVAQSLKKTCGSSVCGNKVNNCGQTVSCGTCKTGQTCTNGKCVNNCVPKTCLKLKKTCGSWDNGCSGIVACGSCKTGQTCTNGKCVK